MHSYDSYDFGQVGDSIYMLTLAYYFDRGMVTANTKVTHFLLSAGPNKQALGRRPLPRL